MWPDVTGLSTARAGVAVLSGARAVVARRGRAFRRPGMPGQWCSDSAGPGLQLSGVASHSGPRASVALRARLSVGLADLARRCRALRCPGLPGQACPGFRWPGLVCPAWPGTPGPRLAWHGVDGLSGSRAVVTRCGRVLWVSGWPGLSCPVSRGPGLAWTGWPCPPGLGLACPGSPGPGLALPGVDGLSEERVYVARFGRALRIPGFRVSVWPGSPGNRLPWPDVAVLSGAPVGVAGLSGSLASVARLTAARACVFRRDRSLRGPVSLARFGVARRG